MTTLEWEAALRRFSDHLAASGASPGTIQLRRYWLSRLADSTDPLTAESAELTAFLAHPGWASAETRKSARASLVTFYGWLQEAELRADNPSHRLPAVRVPRGRPRPAPDRVVRNALGKADERTRLMVNLAHLQGLRRGEIARLHTSNLEAEQLRILGKGGVVRVLPAHPVVAEAIEALPAGWVFPGPRGHLSPDAVGRILSRALGPGWSGHTLRHAAASRWYARTHDLVAVRDLLGHASVATTQIYTATPPDSHRRAITGGEAA